MALPAANDISNAADEGDLKGYFESWLAWTKLMQGGAAETELTIASGVVTLTGPIHSLDTEGGSDPTDDLTNALVTGMGDGLLVWLTLENDARIVTLKHEAGGAGQLSLMYGADLVLTSTRQAVLFYIDIAATPDTLREVLRVGFDAPNVLEVNVAVAASPNILTELESGKTFSNEGAPALNYHTLPSARAGLRYRFCIHHANGSRIVAAAGDTIRHAASVTPAAGYVEATTVGNVIELQALNATEWVAVAAVGTWTVSS